MIEAVTKSRVVAVVIAAMLVLITLICVLVTILHSESDESYETDAPHFTTGAVAADVGMCSDIGVKILKKGGTAVDSAIATLFCQGATNVHSSGIGGGLFMVVYTKKLGKAWFYNGREKAPAAANETMFVNNSQASQQGNTESTEHASSHSMFSQVSLKFLATFSHSRVVFLGALAVGVPGEVNAMYRAWQEHGKLPWKDLVQPAIKLCKKGFPISNVLYDQMVKKKQLLYNDTGFRYNHIFCHHLTLTRIHNNPHHHHITMHHHHITMHHHHITMHHLRHHQYYHRPTLHTTKTSFIFLNSGNFSSRITAQC
jgi:gamma-glutamyltranspeptidase/glutathione hydrolase/leukotriene-C4 hydrolase